MMLKQALAMCLPLLLLSVGVSQALESSGDGQRAVVEIRSPENEQRIEISVAKADAIDDLLRSLADAIHDDNHAAMEELTRRLAAHGIDLELPAGLAGGESTVSNRLCLMYGFFSKALFSYPLDLAVAGILSLLDGFGAIGLFLLWSVLTHALHPVHLVSPLIFLTVLDGSVGQLVTRGLDGMQVISTEELTTHVIYGFVGTIINIIVPVQGAPDPAFCVGAALAVTPAP